MQIAAELKQIRYPGVASRRKLPLPMSVGLRVAQVSPRGLLFTDSLYFRIEDRLSLQSFQPQVLVGSGAELESLSHSLADGTLEFDSLDRALFVITDCRDVPLRDASRSLLWQAFGVPLFELLLSSDGSLIASECEAHEGWHTEPGVAFSLVNGELWFQKKREKTQATGFTGDLEETVCPCGRPGLRILNAAMDYRDPVRHCLAQTA